VKHKVSFSAVKAGDKAHARELRRAPSRIRGLVIFRAEQQESPTTTANQEEDVVRTYMCCHVKCCRVLPAFEISIRFIH
jgi:hypothetical protein